MNNAFRGSHTMAFRGSHTTTIQFGATSREQERTVGSMQNLKVLHKKVDIDFALLFICICLTQKGGQNGRIRICASVDGRAVARLSGLPAASRRLREGVCREGVGRQ